MRKCLSIVLLDFFQYTFNAFACAVELGDRLSLRAGRPLGSLTSVPLVPPVRNEVTI